MSDPITILQQHLQRLGAILNEPCTWQVQLQSFCTGLEETGEQAMAAGFPGLLDVCLVFRDGLAGWQHGTGARADAMDLAVLATWPETVRNYLQAPGSDENKEALIQLVCYPAWGAAISADNATMLKGLLDIHIDPAAVRPASTELDLDGLAEAESTPSAAAGPTAQEIKINDALPAQLRELIGIMITELLNIRGSLQQARALLESGQPDQELLTQSLHHISQTLEFYSDAVTSIDFHGLGAIVTHVRDNLTATGVADPDRLSSLLALLLEWIEAVQVYLHNPVNLETAVVLLNFLRSGRWPLPLSDAQAGTLAAQFQALPAGTVAEEKPQRQQRARPEDVALTLPEDVDQELLEAMLQELPAQTEALSTALQRLNSGSGQDDILIAKRIAHTLKGAGNTVGIRGIATLTHHLEDILLELHKQEALPTPRIMQTLMNAADCLSAMSESLLGLGDPPEDALAVLQEVLDMANFIDQQGLAALDTVGPGPAASAARAPGKDNGSGAEADQPVTGEREMIAMLRVPAAFVDNLLRLIGENKIMTGQINNFAQEALRQMKDMRGCFDQLRLLGSKVQELTDIKDLNQAQRNTHTSRYDALEMDHYTELHTYSKWLSEATVDAHEINRAFTTNLVRLKDMLADQIRLNNETQETVIRARMLPADTHFQRLQRCVRQAAKLTGKPVELHLEGGATLLDGETLNAVLDPLMHLLRNAVDHGIESRGRRAALGKPEIGNITLSFARDGNNILVHCRDDGSGLNLEAIRRKAIARGLLQEDQPVSDAELKQFILHPNFSTKEETTQVSGRGIGLDAVQASISALSGIFSIDSEPGRGSTMRIRLPQKTLSLFALLVRMGPRRLVVANRDIVRIVHHENGKLHKLGEEWTFQINGQKQSALPIEKLLNIFPDRRADERRPRTAIFYGTEAGTTAVMVEKILSSGDFVVKGLGDYVPNIPGILGVTLLGDGIVAPVLDVAELLRHPQSLTAGTGCYSREDYAPAKLPTALVVDDSLSARRSLAQFMQDAGYEVRQARDGMEAMDIILAHKPDLLLSDLEMPRMNGMELTGHVRANAATADLPIIMITSRAAAKHRGEALASGVNVYLTKPYAEDVLLEEIRKLRLGGGASPSV